MKRKKQQEWDWKRIPNGSIFTAKINDTKVSGRIFKHDGTIYLCQNSWAGLRSPNTLNYDFSWQIGEGTLKDLYDTNVINLLIWLPEVGYKIPKSKVPIRIEIGTYSAIIKKDHIVVGCTTVNFQKVKKIYNEMLKLRK